MFDHGELLNKSGNINDLSNGRISCGNSRIKAILRLDLKFIRLSAY